MHRSPRTPPGGGRSETSAPFTPRQSAHFSLLLIRREPAPARSPQRGPAPAAPRPEGLVRGGGRRGGEAPSVLGSYLGVLRVHARDVAIGQRALAGLAGCHERVHRLDIVVDVLESDRMAELVR